MLTVRERHVLPPSQVPVDKKSKKPSVVANKKQDITGADDPVSEIQPTGQTSSQPILSQPAQVAADPNVAPAGVHARSAAGPQTGGKTLT